MIPNRRGSMYSEHKYTDLGCRSSLRDLEKRELSTLAEKDMNHRHLKSTFVPATWKICISNGYVFKTVPFVARQCSFFVWRNRLQKNVGQRPGVALPRGCLQPVLKPPRGHSLSKRRQIFTCVNQELLAVGHPVTSFGRLHNLDVVVPGEIVRIGGESVSAWE
jgi:hypothetical protein